MARKPTEPKLRKQPKPKMQRMNTAVSMPKLSVPKTAKKRKVRTRTRNVQFRLATVRDVVFSPRWLSLILLVVVSYTVLTIARDPRFYLTYIPVRGTNAIPTEEVVRTSGLAGRHIFAADPVEAADAIATLPGVITTTVALAWPNQVDIAVGEEAPIATWQQEGVEYWITPGGALLPARTPAIGKLRIVVEQPLLTLRNTETATAESPADAATEVESDTAVAEENAEAQIADDGSVAETGDDATTDSIFVPPDVLDGALQLRDLRPNIEELFYSPAQGLSYQDGRGWRAYFGTGHNMHQKLAVYETLVENLLARGIVPAVISVSNQERPYYRTQ